MEAENKESKEGKDSHPGEKVVWRKSGVWKWTWRTRSRVARSWMSKGGNCRRSCAILKSSLVCRKSFRKTSRVICNSSFKRWSKGGMTSCQSTRKCSKDHKRHKAFRKKKVLQHKRRRGRSDGKLIAMRIDFRSCRTKSTRTKWSMQKWQQNSRDCRQEKKRRGTNASQTGDCCMEALWEQFMALVRIEVFVQRLHREMGTAQGQMPGREEGGRNSEAEQAQVKVSQQLASSASSGCNEGTPASSLELDLPRVRGAFGECGGVGKSNTAKDERKGLLSNSTSRRPMEEEDASLGDS